MALIKSITLPSGATGDYWRIIQRNSNFELGDDVVTLQLYVSQAARQADLRPLNESVQFVFVDVDYPLSEFDPDRVDTALVDDFTDLELHVRYLHIKDIATAAQAKIDSDPDAELTSNERKALFFADAVDLTE